MLLQTMIATKQKRRAWMKYKIKATKPMSDFVTYAKATNLSTSYLASAVRDAKYIAKH